MIIANTIYYGKGCFDRGHKKIYVGMSAMKTGQSRPFSGFTEKNKYVARVVWAEEPKTGLRFEIGPSYDMV